MASSARRETLRLRTLQESLSDLIDLFEKQEGDLAKEETLISLSNVANEIKATVDAIHIPDDYAREATLNTNTQNIINTINSGITQLQGPDTGITYSVIDRDIINSKEEIISAITENAVKPISEEQIHALFPSIDPNNNNG